MSNSKKNNKSDKNDILLIENLDNVCPEDRDKQTTQLHPLLPKHPARILICGASNSGKGNLTTQMIMKQLAYDRIYVYSKHLHQSKYVFLKEYLTDLEECIKKANKSKTKIPIIMDWTEDLNQLVSCDNLDKEYRNLILIDDYNILTKQQEKAVAKMYTTCRHVNTSIIFVGQLYFRTPRSIRLNLSYIILFNSKNRKEISLLSQEQGASLENKNEFKNLYNSILKEKYSFMVIDNETNDDNLKFRKGWDGIYTRNLL